MLFKNARSKNYFIILYTFFSFISKKKKKPILKGNHLNTFEHIFIRNLEINNLILKSRIACINIKFIRTKI